MKKIISVLLATVIVAFSSAVAYAKDASSEVTGEATNSAAEIADDSTEDLTERRVLTSKDGNYEILVVKNNGLPFVDILKYVGKDNLPKTLKISKIDGYKVRQIRSKAFKNLKSLKAVIFTGSSFGKKGESKVKTKAFYNCPNLKQFSVNSLVKVENLGFGYKTNGEPSETFERLIFDDSSITKQDVSPKLAYASAGEFKAIYDTSKSNNTAESTQVISDFVNGEDFYAKVDGKLTKGWSSSEPDVISISDNGRATVLKKGRATLTVKSGKTSIKREFVVKTNPYFTRGGEKISSVTVGVGKTVKVRINGKADSVDNVYTSTNKARVISDASADVISVEGLMCGSTTLTITVNGKPLKLKVNVLKSTIADSFMSRIAGSIGCQTDYSYGDSTVMCSAYAYAYVYRQVLGITRSAGSFWCPGGCTWEGGTYTHYGSSRTMLKAIKKSIDKNEACVGRVSIGYSSTHYVTFYDYEGEGDSLDDFKILDPWDGYVTTGEYYGYSGGYDVVTVDTY